MKKLITSHKIKVALAEDDKLFIDYLLELLKNMDEVTVIHHSSNGLDLPNGIYYWKIFTGNEIPPNGKIVILK
jgi:hypothetical protein